MSTNALSGTAPGYSLVLGPPLQSVTLSTCFRKTLTSSRVDMGPECSLCCGLHMPPFLPRRMLQPAERGRSSFDLALRHEGRQPVDSQRHLRLVGVDYNAPSFLHGELLECSEALLRLGAVNQHVILLEGSQPHHVLHPMDSSSASVKSWVRYGLPRRLPHKNAVVSSCLPCGSWGSCIL